MHQWTGAGCWVCRSSGSSSRRNCRQTTTTDHWQSYCWPTWFLGTIQLSPPCEGIDRVQSLTALGVVINDRLSATDHVNAVLSSCSGLLYALRYCVRMVCQRHLYIMYFRQPSSPRFYMVHQCGLVCVLLLIVPDSTFRLSNRTPKIARILACIKQTRQLWRRSVKKTNFNQKSARM